MDVVFGRRGSNQGTGWCVEHYRDCRIFQRREDAWVAAPHEKCQKYAGLDLRIIEELPYLERWKKIGETFN